MQADPQPPDRSLPWGVALAAAALTLAVFWPALGNGFIDVYDDGPYVLGNEVVRRGVGWEGAAWAFTTIHVHNWHPVTWLSHMLDVQVFGLDPWGHHLVSVLLHAANAGLALLLFSALGARSSVAVALALLFALHPLRVQSVAWVAERKDVLSAFFGLATLLAWVRHARSPGGRTLLAALALFAMGLLAKPMLVTLPIVLLLLEAWPLGRLRRGGPERRRALLEIAPFLALALATAVATVVAQGGSGAIAPSETFPLGIRLGNAAVTAFAYLGKSLWPAGLSVFYPHPGGSLPPGEVAAAAVALAAVTAGAVLLRRRAPWLAVGWLWYLVMLLPVSGIVQAGRQGMADRYTYLPILGILVAMGWSAQRLLERFPSPMLHWGARGAAAVACAGLAMATRAALPAWHDSRALFEQAMAVTERNSVAANSLGVLAARDGRLEEALGLYRRAVEFDPSFGAARQNLGTLLFALGRDVEAWPHVVEAVRLDPRNPAGRLTLGMALEAQGRLPEAAAEYEAALAVHPRYEKARQRLLEVRAALAGRGDAR